MEEHILSSTNQRPQRKKQTETTGHHLCALHSFFLFTPDLDTYSRWTHTHLQAQPNTSQTHTLLFLSLLTPGGHLQILISTDLSKLQHSPSFQTGPSGAHANDCTTTEPNLRKMISYQLDIWQNMRFYLIFFILQVIWAFKNSTVSLCHYINSWNHKNLLSTI